MLKVVRDLFPRSAENGYSIEDGVYCQLVKSVLSEREVRQIAACLDKWVEANQPIEFLYSKDGYYQYCIGGDIIKSTYPALIEPAAADPFRIVPFDSGFIVDFSEIRKEEDSPFILPQKLAQTYTKTHNWLENIGLELVEDLNRYIRTGREGINQHYRSAAGKRDFDISDAILKRKACAACDFDFRSVLFRQNHVFKQTVHTIACERVEAFEAFVRRLFCKSGSNAER